MLSTERLPQAVVILKDSCGRQINSSSFSFNTKDVEQQIKKLYKFALVSDLCLMLIMLYDRMFIELRIWLQSIRMNSLQYLISEVEKLRNFTTVNSIVDANLTLLIRRMPRWYYWRTRVRYHLIFSIWSRQRVPPLLSLIDLAMDLTNFSRWEFLLLKL